MPKERKDGDKRHAKKVRGEKQKESTDNNVCKERKEARASDRKI